MIVTFDAVPGTSSLVFGTYSSVFARKKRPFSKILFRGVQYILLATPEYVVSMQAPLFCDEARTSIRQSITLFDCSDFLLK